MNIKKILILAFVCAISGCATMVSQSNYPVYLQSAPEKAEFEIKNSRGVSIKDTTKNNFPESNQQYGIIGTFLYS